jgi:RNA polymerase sigma-70 factor, ECF subfamily
MGMPTNATRATALRLQALLEGMVDGSVPSDSRIHWSDGAGLSLAVEGSVGTPSEREQMLVQSACLGDDAALETLCRSEWYGVFYLVSGSVPDAGEAEELTQEVFSRAIASLARFSYVGVPFRSYLAQIARNLLRDRWRAARLHPGSVVPGGRERPPPSGTDPVPTVLVVAEDRKSLVAAVSQLPDRCRDVLRLQLLEGRTADEIGVEWGRSPDVVRRIQQRALSALLAELDGRDAG